MSRFQRIRNIILGLIMIGFAILIISIPEEGFLSVVVVIGLLLFLYGFRLLWYYFTMARHMVGGKSSLYQAVIIIDLALFTGSIASMNSFIIMFYLLGVFAFTGVIDILRAFETKRFGGAWKGKFFTGCVLVLFAVLMLILGVIQGDKTILVYGFALSVIYAGLMRIITAFRKTAIVYIQ